MFRGNVVVPIDYLVIGADTPNCADSRPRGFEGAHFRGNVGVPTDYLVIGADMRITH